jgi:hypothetical protein
MLVALIFSQDRLSVTQTPGVDVERPRNPRDNALSVTISAFKLI